MLVKLTLKRLFLAALFFLTCNIVFAQKTITGTITDDNGQAVVGATVAARGSTAATQTNSDGRFSISIPNSTQRLTVTSVGFEPQDVSIGNQTNISLSLKTSASKLGEVVVTALGITRKTRALQYSVTTVGGDNLNQARENSVVNSLAGRVAGVDVSKIASGPGASTRVVIRGAKTLGQSGGNNSLNQPLYVIDGIPMDNNNFGQAGVWGGGDQGDGMNSINPDDIASMTVLKGASAAALYGSRAANGVILITTKKGSARKGIGVEVTSNYVFEKINNLTDFQQSYGSGSTINPAGTTGLETRVATKFSSYSPDNLKTLWDGSNGYFDQQAWGPKFDGSPVLQFDGVLRPYSYAGDNWKRFYKTGSTFTNTVALSGGSETSNFRFSVSDLNNVGIIPNSGFDRINLSLSGSSKLGKRLTFNTKVLYSNEKVKNRPNISDSPGNAVQSIYRLPGDINVLDLIGDPNKPGSVPSVEDQIARGIKIQDSKRPGEEFQRSADLWTQNPYWAAYQRINSDERNRVIPSAQLRYDITNFLYIQGQAGMDWYNLRQIQLVPEGEGHNRGGSRNEYSRNIRETNYEWQLGFNKAFLNDKIGVNAFVGGNRMRRRAETVGANGTGFNVFLNPAMSNAKQKNFTYELSEMGINSLFGSAEVSYNNYLFVTATTRKDWFSTLKATDNGILYPSVGASFVFSDAFTMPAWLSYGKLRTSWAQVGNAAVVNPYAINLTYGTFNTHSGVPFGGYSTGQSNNSTFPNPDLKPYTSTEAEFGLEVYLFNRRLGLDFTLYNQKTTDDILAATISRASGFGATLVNLGELTNKGIEVLLTGTPVKGPVTWDVSLNFTHNKSKVVSLFGSQKEVFGEEPRTRNVFIKHIIGYPFGMITGKVQARDPNGNLVYKPNGNIQGSAGYEIIGKGVPPIFGGLNNSVTWKGVNLSFLIDYKFGGMIFSGTNMRMTQQGFTKESLLGRAGEAPLILTGVTPDGAGYKAFSKTYTPGEAQSYWANSGSEADGAAEKYTYKSDFIKLRQVTLGYALPSRFLNGTPIQGVVVSFVGRNLAILKKETPNIDPESSYTSSNNQGLDYFGFPSTRTYGFNVKVTF